MFLAIVIIAILVIFYIYKIKAKSSIILYNDILKNIKFYKQNIDQICFYTFYTVNIITASNMKNIKKNLNKMDNHPANISQAWLFSYVDMRCAIDGKLVSLMEDLYLKKDVYLNKQEFVWDFIRCMQLLDTPKKEIQEIFFNFICHKKHNNIKDLDFSTDWQYQEMKTDLLNSSLKNEHCIPLLADILFNLVYPTRVRILVLHDMYQFIDDFDCLYRYGFASKYHDYWFKDYYKNIDTLNTALHYFDSFIQQISRRFVCSFILGGVKEREMQCDDIFVKAKYVSDLEFL